MKPTTRSYIALGLALTGLVLSVLALWFALATTANADDTPTPTATATARPDWCPDAPAPCAGYDDEYTDDNMPLEFDPDGRPVICPPSPAPCAVPGYEDGPPYPQQYDIDGNPLPTGPASTPAPTPSAEPTDGFDPYELDPNGRPVGCPDAPAPCVYLDEDADAQDTAPASPEPTQRPSTRPNLPKTGW